MSAQDSESPSRAEPQDEPDWYSAALTSFAAWFGSASKLSQLFSRVLAAGPATHRRRPQRHVGGAWTAQAMKEATTTIPIVMPLAADVVETGLVADRPSLSLLMEGWTQGATWSSLWDFAEAIPRLARWAQLCDAFAMVYHFTKRIKTLQGRTHYEDIGQCGQKCQTVFPFIPTITLRH